MLSLVLPACLSRSAPTFEAHSFTQPLDHFAATPGRNFSQRYLVLQPPEDVAPVPHTESDTLFFFCGMEGDVTVWANFSRFLIDVSRDVRIPGSVSVVYAEHRFYGNSVPGAKPLIEDAKWRYLTVEQSLADYVALIRHLSTSRTRVVTFGGSYGGMQSAWMRARHPELIFAALASSAPLHFDRVGPSFFALVTDAAEAVYPGCPALVRAGFLAAGASPMRTIASTFGLCSAVDETTEARTHFELWARNALVTLAMGNYPYASDLFGKGLPAWPLAAACRAAEVAASNAPANSSALVALAAAVGAYYNASGAVSCHDTEREYRACADQTGCGDSASAWGESWDREACTEIVYYTSTDNIRDMFPPRYAPLAGHHEGT